MSVLAKLKEATTLHEFAALLGYSAKGLAYVLYQLPMEAKYTTFPIKKKDGTDRIIKAPTPELKKLQSHLANLLYACRDEIEKEGFRNSVSHGFRRGHSIITNAKEHKRRRFVFNIDLEDYFPTFHFGRVRGFFLKDKSFALNEKIATLIAQIACDGTALPQGSPCSPIISDLVAQILDMRLVRFAKKHKVTYSRYADDITFSTSQKAFPTAVAVEEPAESGIWVIGEGLAERLKEADFTANPGKSRMHCRGSRQTVTGLVVNAKVNVSAEYFRNAKAMCRTLLSTGRYHTKLLPLEDGQDKAQPDWTTTTNPLLGIIGHIFHVKRSTDRRSEKEQRDDPDATRKLFRSFLFYRYFVAPDRPLIVGEGKTDNVYLREAIKHLPQYHPGMGGFVEGRFELAVRLFRYSNHIHEIMDIGGGSGDLKSIILDYYRLLPKIQHRPMAFPVILVLDNDDGLQHIVSTIKKCFGVTISKQTTAPYYHLTDNLYVVKTPESGDTDTCIEGLFPVDWLNKELNGKVFNPNKKHGAQGEYGKADFADKVVRPNAADIDFSGFAFLLDRIVAAQNHHMAK
ncbi:retron Ec67 family RNA-directed DNA polymerase/endonuclease [Sphingobium sp. HBC34]|uniref:RNA-directed DNA polymerase n=1 Tax=Sphingobium cyanobacteriorum TaxID=3063954 RepID=A0ABT8ZSB4_9SPHN|nr:retron Ec67 family RNA-directed DNA polymerase/endonuclease [Sphingobium sp. HBC34]MDO7837097.1 retron Ec67 family RNA-directed DNA polymerase/endonuclease [Sphingobium sp. HBC34]